MKKKGAKKDIFSYALDFVTEIVITFIQKLNKLINSKKNSALVKAIVHIVCCLVMLSILEIPFLIVGKLGEIIINLCKLTFGEIIALGWINIVNYSYGIVSLILLFNVIKNMSKKKEYSFSINDSTHVSSNLYYVSSVVLKTILSICLIPLFIIAILMFALLGMLLYCLTHSMVIVGPLLIIIGLLIMIGTSLSYIYDIAFDKGGDK